MKRSKRAWVAGFAVLWMLGSAESALRAQTGTADTPASYAAGRILKADGTKIRVASFVIEPSRVAYRLNASAEPVFLDLSQVGALQVRRPTSFVQSARGFALGVLVGGVVGLLAADRWGGPGKSTWPGIGAGAALFGAAGVVLELTVRSYETVYTNPDVKPKTIIKFSLGPVAPGASGLGLSLAF